MDDKHDTFRSPNGEAKIGQTLERARKQRGLTLDEVEHATKIRKRYLAGLEHEDFGALPDAVYARGFLKTYANYLGLDGEELSRQLKDRRKPRRDRGVAYGTPKKSDFDRPLINPGELSSSSRRKSISRTTVLTLLVGLLALVTLVGTLYYVGRGVQISGDTPAPSQPSENQDVGGPNAGGANAEEAPEGGSQQGAGVAEGGEQDQPVGGNQEGAAGGAAAGGNAAGEDPEPDSLKVVVSVEGAASWLSILVDGSLKYEQIAQPGFSQTFEAQREVSIRTGNAGAVGVEVNGQNLGKLGESGEVLTQDFTLKSAT